MKSAWRFLLVSTSIFTLSRMTHTVWKICPVSKLKETTCIFLFYFCPEWNKKCFFSWGFQSLLEVCEFFKSISICKVAQHLSQHFVLCTSSADRKFCTYKKIAIALSVNAVLKKRKRKIRVIKLLINEFFSIMKTPKRETTAWSDYSSFQQCRWMPCTWNVQPSSWGSNHDFKIHRKTVKNMNLRMKLAFL